MKINVNSDWYPAEQNKMAYFFSRLGGRARGQLRGSVDEVTGIFTYTDVTQMILTLKQAFGVLNQQAESSTTVLNMKQGHKALADFLPLWM